MGDSELLWCDFEVGIELVSRLNVTIPDTGGEEFDPLDEESPLWPPEYEPWWPGNGSPLRWGHPPRRGLPPPRRGRPGRGHPPPGRGKPRPHHPGYPHGPKSPLAIESQWEWVRSATWVIWPRLLNPDVNATDNISFFLEIRLLRSQGHS